MNSLKGTVNYSLLFSTIKTPRPFTLTTNKPLNSTICTLLWIEYFAWQNKLHVNIYITCACSTHAVETKKNSPCTDKGYSLKTHTYLYFSNQNGQTRTNKQNTLPYKKQKQKQKHLCKWRKNKTTNIIILYTSRIIRS